MVDIHSHILFGIDDGCKTLEESIFMLKCAIDEGIKKIILTPHYSTLRGYTESNRIITENFNKLKDAAKVQKLNIELFLGREIDEIKQIDSDLISSDSLSMNNTNYLLLDFGMEKTNIDEYCYHLLLNGYIPIIAHPERYSYIKNPEMFQRWKRTGALIQVNANSIWKPESKTVKKRIKYLFKNNLVDFIASDTHTSEINYYNLRKARTHIRKKYKFKETMSCKIFNTC